MKADLEKVNQGLTETEWAVTCIQFAHYAPEQSKTAGIPGVLVARLAMGRLR